MTFSGLMARILVGLVLLSLLVGGASSTENGNGLAEMLGGVVLFVLFVALLAAAGYVLFFGWLGRDAKARGLHETASWVTYVRSQGFLGLLVYLFSRPSGGKVRCPRCHHRRLASMVSCPFCGI